MEIYNPFRINHFRTLFRSMGEGGYYHGSPCVERKPGRNQTLNGHTWRQKNEKRADRSKTPRHARPWFGVKVALLGDLARGEGQGGVSSSR